jgi:hypothetical protein|tara:strand:+ start:630 stop:860 length:231 start_codon:yes stop_codon:yes gene_type:complete
MNFIKNSYAQLLLYYYKMGVGNVSDITGTTISEVLIDTIERRYEQLGGNSVILRLRDHKPSRNGTLKKRNQRDEHK